MATKFSRREMLKMLGAMTAGVTIASCGSQPPAPTPAEKAAATTEPTAPPPAPEVVELEVKSVQPEYSAQSRQIWDVYQEMNPHVKISLIDVNEDTQAAYDARIAAGNPADIDTQAACTKENYQIYTNLLTIPEFPWEIFHDGAKTAFEEIYGIPDYVPMVNPFAGYYWTFIFYKDKMAEAGLDPKNTVKTMEDLDQFLVALKQHVDENPDVDYVLDWGWHPWVEGTVYPSCMSMGLGHGKEEQRQLFLGEIGWVDLDNNPFVPYFGLLKDWYDRGFLVEKFWTRNWDEFENGNIAQKSILTFHGPWQWDKIMAGNPEAGAQMDGFHWPPDTDGKHYVTPTAVFSFNTNGTATYTANKDKPNAAEAQKAMLWWYSPESIKMQVEAIGSPPACDLSSVGGAKVRHPQHVNVIQPTLDAGGKFDDSLHGVDVAAKYMKGGAENVMESDAVSAFYGDYLEGKMTMEQLMNTFQQRWEAAYDIA